MNHLYHLFLRTEREQMLYEQARQLSEQFRTRAAWHDEQAAFPFDNFAELKEAGLLALTVPKKYGGEGSSLYEFLLVQEMLAQGDGATALSLGWHLGIVMSLAEEDRWPPSIFARLCQEIVEKKVLLNSAHSEAATGSPARGGKPETTAERRKDGWRISGRKTFTSLAPALDYFIVSATIKETGEVGHFLIPKTACGLKIEETWNTLGMRGTRSDDLILDRVEVEEEALVEILRTPKTKAKAQGWLLHIPACYLGIAIAARNDAVDFAKAYKPNSLPHPIAEVPEVQRKIAEIDLELMTARHFMYAVADRWDRDPAKRPEMKEELAAVKYVATNAAVRIVDWSMRIVGAQSLFATNSLQRYYRDVRAGLHNPPADDITLSMLATRALK
ncbi:acyl-CoA/acyl-ACP dehydrogenase [Anoxybacillus rupiensis]|uniref:Acyl-CoA/acyl-ACP dehydrogenase n=1 Tax=Anoxybacteroides rupiense TaxID=311460 RepID=A0ABD5IWR9_9BACL|nr:acyl-CoA dehydrogenase family protein [Anoxybacillus rupiensis]MBB3905742.1 alkylation response protein AidB-like acyl-CoA dehydrogenase [Anoxybacillus rupiensis]MBS2772612.1 acyl-CoA/acyl-ACP dehydrogenase [Anoxybacillus rupiensis]MDE8564126.1 acyl-CoA/acyl-ACP dehydrogenase [Anoxybacillus rupiensis]MED5052254.1 acyl-CoA/acyl-ACP dehydrogenase [Anoxybacillus rupiensis]